MQNRPKEDTNISSARTYQQENKNPKCSKYNSNLATEPSSYSIAINFALSKFNLMKKTDGFEIWVSLSLNDLKCSKILYEQQEFRNSYYLFQQATEKANKAFALKFELANEKDLRDMGHHVFKLNRKYVSKRIVEIDNLLKESKGESPKIKSEYNKLKKGLSELDSLVNRDLMNLTVKEINYLYRYATSIQKSYIDRNPKVKKLLAEKEELRSGSLLWLGVLQWMLDKAFMKISIAACGILAMKHNTLARYPENQKDPTKIYTRKLPIIRKQPVFMDLLEEVVHKMKNFSDEEILHELFDQFKQNQIKKMS